jgi:hypothetical protein
MARPSPKLRKILSGVVGVLAVFVVLHFTFPVLYATGWHLVHGRTVQCANVSVTVPPTWWAAANGNNRPACMLLAESTWFHWSSRSATIALNVQPQTPDPNDEHSRANAIASLAQSGFIVTKVRTGEVAGTPTACYEMRPKAAPSSSKPNEIACIIHNRFSVHYHSDGLDRISDFYDALHSVK